MTDKEEWQKMPDDDVKFMVHATPAPTKEEPKRHELGIGLHGTTSALTALLVQAMKTEDGIRTIVLTAARDHLSETFKDKPD